MSDENVAIIRRLAELVNAGDLEAELGLIHPAVELFTYEEEPEAGVYRGHEGYREYARSWLDTFDDYHVEVDELIDAGDSVVAVARIRATGRSSGAAIEESNVWLYRIRDGMVSECRWCRTKLEALEAAGLAE
jgi:ketosteroid isomerase-like protein